MSDVTVPAGSSSLLQGTTLLQAVVDRERTGRDGLTASRLADVCGMERSRVSRLTQELVDLGFLERRDGGTFRAGPAYFALARSRQERWLRLVRGELRRVVSQYSVGARVSAAVGPARVVLLRYESVSGSVESAVTPGMLTPVWCTGAGRALLWDAARGEVEQRMAGISLIGVGGPRAPRSVGELWDRLEADRARGCVAADEEFEYGVLELALPVRSESGVTAAVSLVCRRETTERSALARELEAVRDRCERWAAQSDAQLVGGLDAGFTE